MSEFKDNFGGILLAYLNDTCYMLDNSQCNELTKLVQRLEDENYQLTAELSEALTLAQRDGLAAIAQYERAQKAEGEVERLKGALREIDHGPVGYWAEPTHHESVIREFMRIARAALEVK